ncbi:hypothetical protein B0T16DRAFT_458896 [Cercophora newfieldiana]|uniref:NACHT domain-containing protein n=1 Tax=Cercophora newfieldiana TaxID=92897 RepID=A0AA40CRQ6_9PEZI|nr:hypothetical protein B0T16DRAFT_458896 [Cercophora newfieldiana]
MASTQPEPSDRLSGAINRFWDGLSRREHELFDSCTRKDVENAIDKIQHDHGAKRALRDMGRLSSFVEAMDHLGKTVGVLLNVGPFVGIVWGPIKFALGIAQTWDNSLNLLLDAYAQIGGEMRGLRHYQSVFGKNLLLREVIADYCCDILEFHHSAMKVFRRKLWRTLFHSTWKTFKTRFEPILANLHTRRLLIESYKTAATFSTVEDMRLQLEALTIEANQQAQKREVDGHKDRMSQIRDKLDIPHIPDHEMDRLISTEDVADSTCGQWLFSCPEYVKWADQNTTNHQILYVHGIPGAGKTTLVTTVINSLIELRSSQQGAAQSDAVLYFYCKYDSPDKQSFSAILRALLYQLLDQDEALSDNLLGEILKTDSVKLGTAAYLSELVKMAFESQARSYVVIDGLDECDRVQACKTLDWFLSLTSQQTDQHGRPGNNGSIHVLFSGQRDGALDDKLLDHPSISLDLPDHGDDIRRYCEKRCVDLGPKFNFDQDEAAEIASRVTKGAHGMFLFAKVVLDNLFSQTTKELLRQELESETFPEGMDGAYNRVFLRVFGSAHPRRRECAEEVIRLVACAKRPLRWREVQATFCIDEEQGNVNYDGQRLTVTCKTLCGAFVDVYPVTTKETPVEGVLKLVHQTARTYLTKRGMLNPWEYNTRLATRCMRYLMTKPFSRGVSAPDILRNAKLGYYAFQDYAVAHWFDHLAPLRDPDEASHLPNDVRAGALEALAHFLRGYSEVSKQERYQTIDTHDETLKALGDLPMDKFERHNLIDIETRTWAIRKVIEDGLQHEPSEILTDAFISLHGTLNIFKCAKPWCESFSDGFKLSSVRNTHLNRHNRPFQCSVEGCFGSHIGFESSEKLEQHHRRHHPKEAEGIPSFPAINYKKRQNAPSLTDAIKLGNLRLVNEILESWPGSASNNNNFPEPDNTPAFHSAKQGHFEILESLLEKTAEFGCQNPDDGDNRLFSHQDAVLEAAIAADNLDIIHLIVSKRPSWIYGQGWLATNRAEPSLKLQFYLRSAAEAGQLSILQFLLLHLKNEVGVDADLDHLGALSETVLPAACRSGSLAVAEYLLRSCSLDISQGINRREGLLAAAERGHNRIVDLILSTVGSLDHGDIGAAALRALEHSHVGIAKNLLASIGDLGCFSEPQLLSRILLVFCSMDESELVERILSNPGINVNYQESPSGPTPLLVALDRSRVEIAAMLLQHPDIDKNVSTDGQITPFILALANCGDALYERRDAYLSVLRALRHPLAPGLLGSLHTRVNISAVVENAIALGDEDILECVWGGSQHEGQSRDDEDGNGEGSSSIVRLWFEPALLHRQFEAAKKVLQSISADSRLLDFECKELFECITRFWSDSLVQDMVATSFPDDLRSGRVALWCKAVNLGFGEIAQQLALRRVSLDDVRRMDVKARRSLLEVLQHPDGSDLVHNIANSFIELGLGDTVLWATLGNWRAESLAIIQLLKDRGAVNFNIRRRDLSPDARALLGLPATQGPEDRRTPLQEACHRLHSEEFEPLIEFLLKDTRVRVHLLDEDQRPLIFSALNARDGYPAILLSAFFKREFDPNERNDAGETILDAAVSRGNILAVNVILSTEQCSRPTLERAADRARLEGQEGCLQAIQHWDEFTLDY